MGYPEGGQDARGEAEQEGDTGMVAIVLRDGYGRWKDYGNTIGLRYLNEITVTRRQAMMAEADRDNNGRVEFAEFAAMLQMEKNEIEAEGGEDRR